LKKPGISIQPFLMRIAGYILSIMVLALTCLPCSDARCAMAAAKAKATHAANQSNDEDHEDACSPFCHCACCAGFSIQHIVSSFHLMAPGKNAGHYSFYTVALKEMASVVWQPPKI
jgi:hypothetical protein